MMLMLFAKDKKTFLLATSTFIFFLPDKRDENSTFKHFSNRETLPTRKLTSKTLAFPQSNKLSTNIVLSKIACLFLNVKSRLV